MKLVVENVASAGKNGVIVNLTPKTSVDWLCQFTPGDYLEIWSPSNPWIARAYSIDNAPRDDGKIEVELRRPPKGRLGETGGVFDLKVGDEVPARGPLGHFHIRSPIDVPLLFIARETGFAPIKSMIEHQLRLAPDRDIALLWDLNDTDDLHHLDSIRSWTLSDKRFRCVISSMRVDDHFTPPDGLVFSVGTIRETLDLHPELDPAGRDVYLAGPRRFVGRAIEELERKGAPRDRIVFETVGD